MQQFMLLFRKDFGLSPDVHRHVVKTFELF